MRSIHPNPLKLLKEKRKRSMQFSLAFSTALDKETILQLNRNVKIVIVKIRTTGIKMKYFLNYTDQS